MSIEVRHLTHCYAPDSPLSSVALDDVSLTINDGEFIGIIGHTGSGKSTLVQHLNGLLKPTSGQVLIDGEDLNGDHVDRRKLRQRIGLVFQYPEYQLLKKPSRRISHSARRIRDCLPQKLTNACVTP